MRFGSLVCVALLAICCAAQAQQVQKQKTLLTYIESLKWDAATKGPLLAIEPEQVDVPFILPGEPRPPDGLEELRRRLVKVGGVSIFAPKTRYLEPDVESKTAYDYLSRDLKIAALMATLTDAEFVRLNEEGLCAADLTGDARQALLTLLPEQVFESYLQKDGNETSDLPRTLNPDERAKIKLQVCRGVEISLERKVENAIEGGPSFTSVEVQTPPGSRSLHSFSLSDLPESLKPKPEVEATEKQYKFDWQDKRLAQPLELKTDEPVGALVDRIRESTKIEIYVDARIADYTLHAVGSSADCGSVLHALAIATDGVIRTVGPAFVITENLEGEATAVARIAGQEFLARRQIEPLVTEMARKVRSRGLFKRIAFLPDDPLVNALPPGGVAGTDGSETNSRPLSSLPQMLQIRAKQVMSKESGDETDKTPGFDRASVTAEIFARWIYPDGRVIDVSTIIDSLGFESEDQNLDPGSPCDASKLPEGSAIKILLVDAESATSMVKTLLAYGFKEIWIDSADPSVIAAAIQAGEGHIDLVIRPWRAIKGEPLSNPDLNVLGLTGSQVANLPQGKLSPLFDFNTFTNTFLPLDPDLGQHWSKLLSLIPKSGLHRVIVLDPAPGGYEKPPGIEPPGGADPSFEADQFSFGSLIQQDPAVNDFGYTLNSRLKFLREHHVDPIDLKEAIVSLDVRSSDSLTVGPIFDKDKNPDKYLEIWKAERKQLAIEALSPLKNRLQSLPYEICFQLPFKGDASDDSPTGPQVVVKAGGKNVQVDWEPLGPDFSEDASGNFNQPLGPYETENIPVCIDFRVSSKDFDRYVKHFFALPAPHK